MNRLLPAVALTLACAATPAPSPLRAGTGVERCVADDGSTLYTDQACRAMGAKAMPVSAALAGRLLQEQALERRAIHDDAIRNGMAPDGATALDAMDAGGGAGDYADASAPLALAVPTSRRSVAAGCARTPTQLQMDLRGAFALGDVNRIAESYHWVGVSPRTAARTMDRLAMLARRQVDDARYFDVRIGDAGAMFADAGGAASAAGGGVMQVSFAVEGGGSITEFDVERYKGCWFVRF